jgi:hypothetical protein
MQDERAAVWRIAGLAGNFRFQPLAASFRFHAARISPSEIIALDSHSRGARTRNNEVGNIFLAAAVAAAGRLMNILLRSPASRIPQKLSLIAALIIGVFALG